MAESSGNRTTYLGVAIAFLPLAVALWITMDSWVFALPFAIVSVTFFILGARSAPGSKTDEDDAA